MNLRTFTLLAALVAGGWGAVAWTRQQREIDGLRQRIETRRSADAARHAAVSAAETAARSSDPAPSLTSAERLELMALRRKVTEASEAKRRLARLVEKNAALQQRTTSASNMVAKQYPPGWVRRGDARRLGTAKPEEAFETFVWALHHRDTNALFEVVHPEARAMLERNMTQGGPVEFWRMADAIAGFRIVQVRISEGDKARLVFEMMPGEPGPEMNLQKIEGAWRLSM